MAEYDAKRKRDYYLRNREKRINYQKKYYQNTKYSNSRRLEVLEVLEPERYAEFKKRISDYNREYYKKNKEKILNKRKLTAVSRQQSEKKSSV